MAVYLALSGLPAQAAMRTMALEDLTRLADTIVIGTVVEQTSSWDAHHTIIFTDITLAVERVLAGTPGERVTVRVDGGIVGGMGMRTSNDASFTKDERALVFLNTREVPSRLVGLRQGKFTLQDNLLIGAGETWELETLLNIIRGAVVR